MASPRGYSLQKELNLKGYKVTLLPTDNEFIDDQARWIRTNLEEMHWLVLFIRWSSKPDAIVKSFIKSELEIEDPSQPGVKIPFQILATKGNILIQLSGNTVPLMLDQWHPVGQDAKGQAIEAKVAVRLEDF